MTGERLAQRQPFTVLARLNIRYVFGQIVNSLPCQRLSAKGFPIWSDALKGRAPNGHIKGAMLQGRSFTCDGVFDHLSRKDTIVICGQDGQVRSRLFQGCRRRSIAVATFAVTGGAELKV